MISFGISFGPSRYRLVLDYAAMQRSQTMHGPVVFALISCVFASGCAPSLRPELTIHDSPRGRVYLERVPDTSLQATHPITLDSGTIARALRGIHVRDNRNTLQTLFASQPAAVRAFRDEEADFLAPLIATAFTRATPDQRIGFRIIQTGLASSSQSPGAGPGASDASKETTSGILFAYGRSLQMTLTRLRSNLQNAYLIDGPNRHYADPTGLTGRELVFFPKEAQRPDAFRVGGTEALTIVIDYELLARLPDQPVESTPASSVSTSPAQPAAPPAATAQEVEDLKKELREIKRQLNEQQSRKDSPKQKSKPAPTQ
jgi:hypothetical protein